MPKAGELAGLGRLPSTDPRNKNFPLARARVPPGVRSRTWSLSGVLDQGATPMCVGYSGYQWLKAGPVANTKMPFQPADLYAWAQKLDEFPGENYEGTSALGLMKALQERGYVTEYRWALDVETMLNWVLSSGPLLMGSVWRRDMFTPGRDGFIVASGEDMGGHEYLLIGANRDKVCPDKSKGAFRICNSWGPKWGQNGRVWISKNDMAALLAAQGDCVTATEVQVKGAAKGKKTSLFKRVSDAVRGK